MHAINYLATAAAMLISLAVARPMPSPQMLNTKVGESNIYTQLEGAPIVPRMAQMENVRVKPGGGMWTELQGGEPIPVSQPETTVSQIRRMLDARWW